MKEDINNKLIDLSKQVSKFCIGMEGNISAKKNSGLIIKASGSKLFDLGETDLVGFDMNGNQLSNFDKRGSMELSFHTFLLGFEDISYVAHTHPVNTLKILCSELCESFSNKRLFPDQVVFNGRKSCLVPYSKPGENLTDAIKKHLFEFMENEGYFPKLILLKNHGIIACGKTADECVMATEICEKAAEIFVGISGKASFLSESECDDLFYDENEKYRQNLLK
jgi:ribulose-5-phosphate 4-epimerase/fuculose-1-phosphate aldolase